MIVLFTLFSKDVLAQNCDLNLLAVKQFYNEKSKSYNIYKYSDEYHFLSDVLQTEIHNKLYSVIAKSDVDIAFKEISNNIRVLDCNLKTIKIVDSNALRYNSLLPLDSFSNSNHKHIIFMLSNPIYINDYAIIQVTAFKKPHMVDTKLFLYKKSGSKWVFCKQISSWAS